MSSSVEAAAGRAVCLTGQTSKGPVWSESSWPAASLAWPWTCKPGRWASRCRTSWCRTRSRTRPTTSCGLGPNGLPAGPARYHPQGVTSPINCTTSLKRPHDNAEATGTSQTRSARCLCLVTFSLCHLWPLRSAPLSSSPTDPISAAPRWPHRIHRASRAARTTPLCAPSCAPPTRGPRHTRRPPVWP